MRGRRRGGCGDHLGHRRLQPPVELGGSLQHEVVADAVHEGGVVVAVLPVRADLRDRAQRRSGLDGPHRHPRRLHPRGEVEVRVVAEQGDRGAGACRGGARGDQLHHGRVGGPREHRVDHGRHRPGEVLLVEGGELPGRLRGDALLDVVEGVDSDDAHHAPRHAAGGVERHRAAHRMADQHHPVELQRQDHGLDVAAQAIHRPPGTIRPRGPMAPQVEGHHLVLPRERIDLLAPEGAVAGPAVDEDDGRLPLAADVVGDREAVLGPGRSLLHSGRRRGRGDEGGQGRGDHLASSPGQAETERRS